MAATNRDAASRSQLPAENISQNYCICRFRKYPTHTPSDKMESLDQTHYAGYIPDEDSDFEVEAGAAADDVQEPIGEEERNT